MIGQLSRVAKGTHAPHSLRQVVEQVGWVGAVEVTGLILRYALVFVIAKVAGSLGLGLYALALTFGNGMAMLARMGLDQAAVRFIPYYHAREEAGLAKGVARFSVAIATVLSTLAAGGLFLLAPYIGVWWGEEGLRRSVRLMALAVPAITLGEVCRAGLRGFYDVALAAMLERVTIPLATMVAIVGMWAAGMNHATVPVAAAVVGTWSAAVIAWLALVRRLKSSGARPAYHPQRWVRFAVPMLLEAGLLYALYSIDQVMVGWFRDAYEVGVYSAAVRVSWLVALPLWVVNPILAPTIAGLHARNDREAAEQLYARLTWACAFVGLGITLGLWVAGRWILQLIGGGFTTAYLPLAILVAGQAVNVATGSSGIVLGMTGHPGWRLTNAACAVGLNTTLNCFLIPPFGITGAAVATAASIAVINVAQVLQVRCLTGLWAYGTESFPRVFLSMKRPTCLK